MPNKYAHSPTAIYRNVPEDVFVVDGHEFMMSSPVVGYSINIRGTKVGGYFEEPLSASHDQRYIAATQFKRIGREHKPESRVVCFDIVNRRCATLTPYAEGCWSVKNITPTGVDLELFKHPTRERKQVPLDSLEWIEGYYVDSPWGPLLVVVCVLVLIALYIVYA